MLTSACQGSSYSDAVAVHGQDGCVRAYIHRGLCSGGLCVHTGTLCHVCACVRVYTCCGQCGSLGVHTVEGCVLVYAVVGRALGVSAYQG